MYRLTQVCTKSQVTLLGHEAGAASLGYHLLSNRSAAYFQRAVMMAGSPYAPYPENSGSAAERNVRALARELRCPDSSARRAAIDCLKSRSVRATLEAADSAGIEFGPSYLSPQTGTQDLYDCATRVRAFDNAI
ncbi:hypothetical protein HPB52_013885 [Rhipicephalus sanguineus]|uniref:Carboxylesterase type B domain-containing protein n=1 Tax=Rhipicephalus sanguineus TaxID=34632 RepID=A0A9D4T0T3_RHISA|nr:hypothetical protein HPB52_013885 [Rhipicephalus sanguineus]